MIEGQGIKNGSHGRRVNMLTITGAMRRQGIKSGYLTG